MTGGQESGVGTQKPEAGIDTSRKAREPGTGNREPRTWDLEPSTRVAVGLSGGVDSAVAAALLARAGHEVVGFTLKVWDDSRCCSLDDVEDARRVAQKLHIPFYVLDAHEVFEVEVVAPFVEAYQRGRTPNPCVVCNRRVKFRWLLERARAVGCDGVATGHYARLDGPVGRRRLRRGLDRAKDQSYFLVPEHPEDLERVSFPLGALTKARVRAEAEGLGLSVAEKAESQDVCFVPDGDLEGFLEGRLGEAQTGDIVDRAGKVVGRHRGVAAYTVGQRKGLGVATGRPVYVVEKDARARRLVVGPREAADTDAFETRETVWMPQAPVGRSLDCTVKVRSTGGDIPCVVEPDGPLARVRLETPVFAVAPGQMAVFYDGDTVLGGGWIEKAGSGDP